MAHMNIFEQDAFSMMELTRGLEDIPYKPGLIGGLGLFNYQGIRVRNFSVESRAGVLTLIPFSEPGGPATQADRNGEERKIRDFRTRHFNKQDTLWAAEVDGIREFGQDSELMQVMKEVARRAARLRAEAELTFEYHRLNALQGLVKNPSNGAVIYNWYTEFGITPAAEINFDLDNATPAKGALKKKCQETVQSMEDSIGGLVPGSISVEAVVDNTFWNALTTHKEVMEAYMHAGDIASQRGIDVTEFMWGGILWRRYRGGSGVAVPTGKALIYVAGIDDMFEEYASPAETLDFVNTPGMRTYYRMIPDRDRNAWIKVELESNPMFVCRRPKALRVGKKTA